MRFVTLYLVLVGLPILGVLGILRAGQELTAPRSVSGTWVAETSFGADSAGACWLTRLGADRLAMVVSQSGSSLEVVLQGQRPLSLLGTIQRDRLNLRSEGQFPTASGAAAIALEALLGDDEPQHLTGVIDGGCGPAALQASRPAAAGGNR